MSVSSKFKRKKAAFGGNFELEHPLSPCYDVFILAIQTLPHCMAFLFTEVTVAGSMCGSISENCTTRLYICVCACVREKERETGLQLNRSCLCACSLNPLSVKTQFVWELKETSELLKLAEASLIENQQTTETPQHIHTH